MAGKQIEVFRGIYREQMPILVQRDLVPTTIADIMKLKLEGKIPFDEYYDAVSGIAYAGNNKDEFKIIPYSKILAEANPNTRLYSDKGAEITPEYYDKIKATKFTRKDMPMDKRSTEKEILKHLGWLELAEYKELLAKYAEELSRRVYDRYEEREVMVFRISDLQEVPNIRPWFLGQILGRSVAYGRYGLIHHLAHLVGASKKSLEEIAK